MSQKDNLVSFCYLRHPFYVFQFTKKPFCWREMPPKDRLLWRLKSCGQSVFFPRSEVLSWNSSSYPIYFYVMIYDFLNFSCHFSGAMRTCALSWVRNDSHKLLSYVSASSPVLWYKMFTLQRKLHAYWPAKNLVFSKRNEYVYIEQFWLHVINPGHRRQSRHHK